MWARRIVRLTLVLLLLAAAPDRPSAPVPGPHIPAAEGAWVDIGLRLAPDRPWSTWKLYLDLHLDATEPPDTRRDGDRSTRTDPDVAVEIGAEEFSRVVGGIAYALLREAIDRVLPGNAGS